ncbi:MAG TPA: prepilin-type N-terminal cleavage/methylation domain-containing protein [bacterium]|nr:prepilin-type N-terminal cleavage/methylation domain-containing protein [bacterium]HQQ00573.1 prepilin-type N-terminal cleavage/methylation domain-containing protein [bacterium]
MKHRAFTLIELLIVVAIIGILAAIAVPRFLDAQVRAKMAHGQVSLDTLETGIHALVIDKGVLLIDKMDYETEEGKNRIRDYFNSVGLERKLGYDTCATFAPLTTPISYLSSLPTDPFGMRINVDPSSSETVVLNILPANYSCMGSFIYWDNEPKIRHPVEPDYRIYENIYGQLEKNEFIIFFLGPIPSTEETIYQPSNGVISPGVIYVRSKG